MKYFRSLGLCILVCFTIVQGFAQKRIAVIGSSSAYGFFPVGSGIPRDSAWAFKIKKYYKDLGVIDTLFNLGQNSTDCFEGMPSSYVPPAGFNYRLPNPNINITKAVKLIPKPDVIIVNYPSNNYDWISNAQVIACLQTIKDSANAQNIKCYITTTQPRDGFSPSERQNLKTLRDLILAQFGEWAIDFYSDIVQEPGQTIKTEYSAGDGVHLNPLGHTILKNKVIEKNIFFSLVSANFSELTTVPQSDHVLLKWQTLNEINNKYFLIQKSTDAIHFITLDSIIGAYNSVSINTYSYKDKSPNTGRNYYRIIAVSSQEQKTYSNIAMEKYNLNLANNVTVSSFNNEVILNFKEPLKKSLTSSIYNLQGKLITSFKILPNSSPIYHINTSNLAVGKYILRIAFEDHPESFQIMKM